MNEDRIDAIIATRDPLTPESHFARRRELIGQRSRKAKLELLVLEREFELWWQYGLRRNWPTNGAA